MKKIDYHVLERFVKKAQNGDPDAFHKLYEMTAKTQYFYITQILPDVHEAQDVLQETYFLLYQNIEKISPASAFYSYLTKLSYYISKNYVRKRNCRLSHTADFEYAHDVEDSSKTPQEYVEETDSSQRIRTAVSELSSQQRSVITMRYYQHMTMEEIAFSMNLSRSTVQRLYRSAKKELEVRLAMKGLSAVIFLPSVVKTSMKQLSSRLSIPEKPFTSDLRITCSTSEVFDASAPRRYLQIVNLRLPLLVAGLSAAAVMGSRALPGPKIHAVNIPVSYCGSPAPIELEVSGIFTTKEISVRSASGILVPVTRKSDRIFLAQIPKNGSYTVKAVSYLGQKATKKLLISCIDQKLPAAQILRFEKNSLLIRFTDEESGINPGSIYCKNEKGDLFRPYSYDKEKGTALFALPSENMLLYYGDMAGNIVKAPLEFLRKKAKR